MSRILSRTIFQSRRALSTSAPRLAFATGPAPPRLPPKEQAEFEKLQQASTGAFSTPRSAVTVNQSPASTTSAPTRPQINQSPDSTPPKENASGLSETEKDIAAINARVAATGNGEELHPDIRRGARPEFEGERNPTTGETGGPKNEPLRWGSTSTSGDWSYNGRVTDF